MSSRQLALMCSIVWKYMEQRWSQTQNLAELLTVFLALGFGCRQTKGIRRSFSPSYQSMSLILQRIHADVCARSILHVQFCFQQ